MLYVLKKASPEVLGPFHASGDAKRSHCVLNALVEAMPFPPTNSITIYCFAQNLAQATFLRSDPNLDGPASTMRRNLTCTTEHCHYITKNRLVF